MNHYKCALCGSDLDIDDGRWCSPCFVKEHAKPVVKQEPTLEELHGWLNDPLVFNFLESVKKEVAFQKSQWTVADTMKDDSHWHWLLARLATKALNATSHEKRQHHKVTMAAVCFLWHDAEYGSQG